MQRSLRASGWTLALLVLVATGPAAYADQWSDANLRRAEANTRLTNQNIRRHADGLPAAAGAPRYAPPRGEVRRARTEHEALINQGNDLSHQSLH